MIGEKQSKDLTLKAQETFLLAIIVFYYKLKASHLLNH